MDTWRIGPIIWGALLMWIGIMKIIDEPSGTASIGAGVIMLVGALWRRSVGRRAGFILSVMGILLVALGFKDTATGGKGIPLFATALIAIGALIVTKAIAVSRYAQRSGIVVRYGSRSDRDV
jgi:hypothetical protein